MTDTLQVDVWAYGCTLFECGTGAPPNANLRERMQIGRQLSRNPPKLEGDSYSEELRSLVSFALNADPASRPTMKDILQHPYIAGTEEKYPTSSLSELVRIYYQWTQSGGQRISLFNPGGAMPAEFPGTGPFDGEDWNFSTTDNFERRFSLFDFDQLSASLSSYENQGGYNVPHPQAPLRDPFDDLTQDMPMTAAQLANFDERVKRGAVAMEGLFDEAKPDYKYVTKNDFVPVEERPSLSDLPLRTETDRSSVASTFLELNLGAFDSSHYAAGTTAAPPFQLVDALTIKANRNGDREIQDSNMNGQYVDDDDQDDYQYQQPSGPRPPTMEWTFPQSLDLNEQTQTDTEATVKQPSAPRPPTMDWSFPAMTRDDDTEKPDKQASKEARPPTMEWTFPDLLKGANEPSAVEPVTAKKERPPTMAWTWPSMEEDTTDSSATIRESRLPADQHFPILNADPSDADVEDGADSGPGEIVIESRSASPDDRKGEIESWNMSGPSDEPEKEEGHNQWRRQIMHTDPRLQSLPKIETNYVYRSRGASVSMSRPSTAASSDTDPFRLDGPGSPIIRPDDQETSTPVPDEPGSVIEEDEGWQNHSNLTARQTSRDIGVVSPGQFISPGVPPQQITESLVSPMPISIGSSRAGTPNEPQFHAVTAPSLVSNSSVFSSRQSSPSPTNFPAFTPPNLSALEPDMPDEFVVAELDRLLSSLMQGFSATQDLLLRHHKPSDSEHGAYIR